MSRRIIFLKKFLIKEYIKNKKSIRQIARERGCSINPIREQLGEYNIPIRTMSEIKRNKHVGSNNPNFKDNRCSIQHYCPICKVNRISHNTWLRNGKCQKCYYNIRRTGHNFAKCIDCGKKLSTYKVKRCRSCAFKGKFNPNFGKPPKHGKGQYYKNIYMRSSYEIKFAKYLDKSGIKWYYEPKYFELKLDNKITTYTPDFFLPKTKEYIEIKGWWRHNSKEKFLQFKKQYPKVMIKVLEYKELIDLKILKRR